MRLKAEVGALLSGSMGMRAFRSQSVNRAGNTIELLMDGGCREKNLKHSWLDMLGFDFVFLCKVFAAPASSRGCGDLSRAQSSYSISWAVDRSFCSLFLE